ncbi:MAG TPA: TAT-variant-translocated molybdopterin oxidoreductase [Acidobacteriaceae bacterium]|jgi:molybdopterin-containing oxidoreductase family iron-sulfur binding subunit|nr:TAT-variant-translocated molybdopterin oxidoreductase [Acidobacteriaceae bacterium]
MKNTVQNAQLTAQNAELPMAAGENGNDLAQIEPKKLTLDEVRAKLANQKGKKFWRSVDELADEPEFAELVNKEFPSQASEWIDPVSRRSFLKVMGASMALAGLAGCTKQPDEPIYPYVTAPSDLILGKPAYFASAFPFTTGAVPVLIKSAAYRPIKVDGNPEHPYTRGGSDPITQATLLDMYDPDRSQHVLYRGETRPWVSFLGAFRAMLADKKASGGQGVYFLSATVTSPTLARQWQEGKKNYPQAKFVQYDPVNRDNHYAAAKQAFGDYVDTQYRLDQADVIVSLDADFLGGVQFPGFHQLARDYAGKRKLQGTLQMNRLYVVEPVTTLTGFKAEHRLAVPPSRMAAFAQALAAALGTGSAQGGGWSDHEATFLQGVAADLRASAGKCVVIPGEFAPPEVHLAAFAMNQALGNVGKTVAYSEPVNPMPSIQTDDLRSLVADMNAGKVDWLVILNANPVYTVPADLDFETAMSRVGTVVHLGSHVDETAQTSHWHINNAHYLEMWSDARSYDGTVSIVQPMIEPLYGGRNAHEIVQSLLDNPDVSAYDAVRATWMGNGAPLAKGGAQPQAAGNAANGSANNVATGGDAEFRWRKVLHDGWIANTAFTPKNVTAKAGATAGQPARQSSGNALEIAFRPDANVYDGRFANVGWMQEIPRPITNLAWDNAAQMSYATMEKLGLQEDDEVEIALNGKKISAGALAVPGQADGVVVVTLGQGRRIGRVAGGVGYNAYLIRPSTAPWSQTGGSLRKTGGIYDICVTKSHHIDQRAPFAGGPGEGTHSLEGDESLDRGIIRYATLTEYRNNPEFAHEGVARWTPEPGESMFPAYRYDKNAWGMSIDLNSCVGCNACIAACYAENNIPVVGRLQAKIGRIMQWIRIDTYFEGDLSAPRAHYQPMTCHQCENAPCEQVCPVGATVHSPEGLNMMVYNRCVGTRYCSNNCPYKVRRFNFLLYSDYDTPSLALMRNPEVSVRSRGVMEKCSYCVQRIEAVKIEADKDNRPIRDGEIRTACQQACPTSAIVFGNINDKTSEVAKLKTEIRTYGVLADINTRPRTTYVAGVLNVNEELAKALGEYAT